MRKHIVRDQEVENELKKLYDRLGTWRAVAGYLGLNVGLIHQVAHGRTTSPAVRFALGLPPTLVKVAPCPCGQVHAGTCHTGRQITRRARSSDPELLEHIQLVAVPWLEGRLNGHEKL